MKNRFVKLITCVAVLCLLCVNVLTALAVDVNYNEFGAHQGIDPDTPNADMSDLYSDEAAQEYIHAGKYIVSNQTVATGEYAENGTYYENITFEYGGGLYIIIQDEDSTSKFYTMIKSAQDLEVGDSYCYVEGDIGGRLLDDKYTSTHMANNYLDGEYSYVSYDLSGGKFEAQDVVLDAEGIPEASQPEGFTYVYLVAETPEDYYQRLSNEAAGYEDAAQSEDRPYMPVNNHNTTGSAYNNWANIDEDSESGLNDGIMRAGGNEGDSNTRLFSYSGQNVIVAKVCIALEEVEAKLAWSYNADFDPDEDYTATTGEIEIAAGESMELYFHTQFTSTWGRDGYASAEIIYEIEDESIISYVGASREEDVTPNTLTALEAGTTTLKATVADSEGKYTGGASITLTITVE